MWIRSQTKKMLLKLSNVNKVAIEPCTDGSRYYVMVYWDTESDTLGTYFSFEKALKVLDEIRNELNDAQYYEIENNGHGMYTLNTGIRVYTMPDDEDVEV